MKKLTYEWLKENNLILFEIIVGSQAYGTALPTSDIDKKFVYILPKEFLYGFDYVPQIEITKDYVGYEVKRFLELIASNNPSVLEFLDMPEDCIVYKNPIFDLILKKKSEFITKVCNKSFCGYAAEQIKKADGLDKMLNWEKEEMVRREPLDFCNIIGASLKKNDDLTYEIIQDGYSSYPLEDFLKMNGMDQKFCGVSAVPHARDVYALFYDWNAHYCFSEMVDEKTRELNKSERKSNGDTMGLGYKGVVKFGNEDEEFTTITKDNGVEIVVKNNKSISNALRLSSIHLGEKCLATFSYNKDGYTSHCDRFKKYQTWLQNRNTTRYVESTVHNQKVDSKNLMHCTRLLRMAKEISEGKGLIIRRPDAKELLEIRKGEVDLRQLIKWAKEEMVIIDKLFKESNLPNNVDSEMVNNLLIDIRNKFYNETELHCETTGSRCSN